VHENNFGLVLALEFEHNLEDFLTGVRETAGFELPEFKLRLGETELAHAGAVFADKLLQFRILLIVRKGHAVDIGFAEQVRDESAAAQLDVVRVSAQKKQ
jgi:hypothetical protein